jgi:2-isopropylmalate synthase
MQYKLKMSPEQVLEMIEDAVSYAKKYCGDVEFSAEDAMRSEPEFLAKAVYTAIKAGATVVNIPDTVGYSTPSEMAQMISYLKNHVENIDKAEISVHCHNDLGMAVAKFACRHHRGRNSGGMHRKRPGRASGQRRLEEIVMALQTRKNLFGAYCNVDATKIYQTSRLVYNILGLQPPLNKAIVGQNAFAHEGGNPPARSARESRDLRDNHASIHRPSHQPHGAGQAQRPPCRGEQAFRARLHLEQGRARPGFQSFKELADKKKMVTDRDLEALLKHKKVEEQVEGFKLERFTVNSGNYVTSNAVVRLSKGDKLFEEVAIGDGPIDAAYKAIDKIIDGKPRTLENYSIHSITEGEDALGEAVVKVKSGDAYATGRGLSTDVIEASILAYLNAVNKLLQD